jgi:hypothetical protein
MQDDLDRVTRTLVEASAEIPQDYFALPVYGKERAIYRERVYCYELYHQWRSRWSTDWYSLCGEIDKSGHPVIRSRAKPDFLVHSPRAMVNLLAIEVKPANVGVAKMVKDLETLTFFRRALGQNQDYFAAYFMVYGLPPASWACISSCLVARVSGNPNVDLRLIRPLIHSAAAQSAAFMTWPDNSTV